MTSKRDSYLFIGHRATGLILYGSAFVWCFYVLGYCPQPSANASIWLFDWLSYFPGALLFSLWILFAYFYTLASIYGFLSGTRIRGNSKMEALSIYAILIGTVALTVVTIIWVKLSGSIAL